MRILWYDSINVKSLNNGVLMPAFQGLPRSNSPPQIPRIQRGLPEKRNVKDVRKTIAISSAKGGVGKSTIAGRNINALLLEYFTQIE